MTYEEILAELARRIKQSDPGTKLPTERSLMAHYQVPRSLIRRALSNLENRLLIRREKGVGAFVSDRAALRITTDDGPSLHAAVTAAGYNITTDLVESDNGPLPADYARMLGCNTQPDVLRLVRVGTINDMLATHSEEWVLPERARDLYAALGIIESVYDSLKSFGFEPYRLRSTAGIEDIPADVLARWKVDEPMLGWRVVTQSADRRTGDMLMISETWLRMDVIRFEFDFSN